MNHFYKKNFFITCFSILSTLSFSQNLEIHIETYNGAYEFGENTDKHSGKAVYQYYEDINSRRIFQGSFTFSDIQYKVTGNFKENLKDGLWLYIEKATYSQKYTTTTSGNYTKGVLQGLWNYKKVELSTNKVLKQSSVYFKNGVPIGDYQYSDFTKPSQMEDQYNITVKGSYDTLGNPCGKWIIKYLVNGIPFEMNRFYNGDSCEISVRDLSTGKPASDYQLAALDQYRNNHFRLHWDYCISFWTNIDSYDWYPSNPIFKIVPQGAN